MRKHIGQEEGKPFYFVLRLLHFIFMPCFQGEEGCGQAREERKEESKNESMLH